jgi:hypothetical protein
MRLCRQRRSPPAEPGTRWHRWTRHRDARAAARKRRPDDKPWHQAKNAARLATGRRSGTSTVPPRTHLAPISITSKRRLAPGFLSNLRICGSAARSSACIGWGQDRSMAGIDRPLAGARCRGRAQHIAQPAARSRSGSVGSRPARPTFHYRCIASASGNDARAVRRDRCHSHRRQGP